MIPENICSLFATRHDLSFQDEWAIQVSTELNAKQLLLPVIDFIIFCYCPMVLNCMTLVKCQYEKMQKPEQGSSKTDLNRNIVLQC